MAKSAGVKVTACGEVPSSGTAPGELKAKAPATEAVPPLKKELARDWPARIGEAEGQSNTTITLTALVRTNDPNLVFTPEATLGLGSSSSWTSSGFTLNTNNQTNVPAGFERREYQLNAGTNPRAFLKLTIEQQ